MKKLTRTIDLEALLDNAALSLLGMRALEIEAAELKLAAEVANGCSLEPDARGLTGKLRRVRHAALHAARLWHAYLPPANDSLGYSSDGAVQEQRTKAELSVTG